MSRLSISVVIPTLNAEKVLGACLDSISSQNYPQQLVEIVVADGGSQDGTMEIAKKFGAKIVDNSLKTGESGKAVGIKAAKGAIIALIDSDNILPTKDWLVRMVEPFRNTQIILTEPWEYTYRKTDPWLTRYFALLGMNDPVCLFIGNYDRRSVLYSGWQGLGFEEIDHTEWLEVVLDSLPIPTIGANGTMIRRDVFKDVFIGDYYFDIDIPVQLVTHYGEIRVAKTKVGIVHTFVEDSAKKFFRKQWRRITDYGYHHKQESREVDWSSGSMKWGLLRFILACVLLVPLLIQTFRGLLKSRDWCFLFHPVACYGTLFIYGWGVIRNSLVVGEASRNGWRQ